MATSPEPNVKAGRRSSSSFSQSSNRTAAPTRNSSSAESAGTQSRKSSGSSSLRTGLRRLSIANYWGKSKQMSSSDSTLVGPEESVSEEVKESPLSSNVGGKSPRSESPSPLHVESPSTLQPYHRSKGTRKNTGNAFEGGFLGVLQVLGKAPVPGIEMVTNGLAEVISRATVSFFPTTTPSCLVSDLPLTRCADESLTTATGLQQTSAGSVGGEVRTDWRDARGDRRVA